MVPLNGTYDYSIEYVTVDDQRPTKDLAMKISAEMLKSLTGRRPLFSNVVS